MAAIASAGGDTPAPFAANEKQDQFEVQWQSQDAQDVEQSKRQDIFDVATCSNPGTKKQRKRAKRKSDSLSSILCAAIVQHQLGGSILQLGV